MNPTWTKWLLNTYPPYWGTGIRITHLARDWRALDVEMPLRWYNRNAVGTHFGGSLSSMTDPFYMLMLMNLLGRDYRVWDQSGTIEYRKPGRGRVHARFRIDDDLIDAIRRATDTGEPYRPTLAVDIVDDRSDVVAHVTRTLHIRRLVTKTETPQEALRTAD
ncbi:DUF4442 domain-containing protein [Saccharospirillum salsuginis]|uniref:DUF4442 domain-containing protein n=1 Tax=Saccharospirillum salsuginis TaxID=418750 RepID=A0A918KLX5_9GAMM|nr:DUF4442 domain-containing protein [Saccharospirillum salsuginis]GGX68251.1 DUF4442 domain-containing protein [Saccharospirillum salsuginis]